MSNENWNPGHSVNKGYPYDGIESKKLWPTRNRVSLGIDDNQSMFIAVEKELFPEAPELPAILSPVETFLLHRMYDFKKALDVAEDQLEEVFEERPFIPERLGFEVIHNNKSPFEGPPMRIYLSKYSDHISIYRKPSENPLDLDPSELAKWMVVIKKPDNTFHEIEADLPCERIAYAFFFAIGMKMPSTGKEANSGPVREESPVINI